MRARNPVILLSHDVTVAAVRLDAEWVRGAALRTSLATARLYLVGVTVLWGTYTPVVRRLFMEEGAPDPTTLTLVRSVFAAAALLLASLWTPADSQPNGTDRSGGSLRSMDRCASSPPSRHVCMHDCLIRWDVHLHKETSNPFTLLHHLAVSAAVALVGFPQASLTAAKYVARLSLAGSTRTH